MIDPFLVGLDGRMDVVIGEVEQEGLVFVSFLKETDGLLSQALGQVLAFLFRLQSRVVPRGVVATGRGAPVVTSDVEVEPLVGRPMPFIAKVPLPREEGLVAMDLQFLGDGHLLMSEVVSVVWVK